MDDSTSSLIPVTPTEVAENTENTSTNKEALMNTTPATIVTPTESVNAENISISKEALMNTTPAIHEPVEQFTNPSIQAYERGKLSVQMIRQGKLIVEIATHFGVAMNTIYDNLTTYYKKSGGLNSPFRKKVLAPQAAFA